MIVDVFSKQR